MIALRRRQGWQDTAARRRKSPWMVLLAVILSLAQMQYALAAITNTVVATGTYGGSAINSPPATENVDVQDLAPDLNVDKRARTPTYVNAGEVLAFDIDVTNTGNATLSAVTVSDPDADAVVCPGGGAVIATMAPGETVTCIATMIVVPADVTAGFITNTIEATATDPAGNPVGPARDTETVLRTPVDLVTIKSLASADATPSEGATVIFRIDVTNNGPEQATGVELTDVLPAGLTYVSDTGGGVYDSGTGVWNVGTIPAGVTVSLEISATVDAGTVGQTITNNVAVTGLDQNDSNPNGDDLTESIEISSADLVTVKSLVTGGTFRDGDTVQFQIVVTNNGPDEATNVDLTDILPAGLTASPPVATASQGSFDEPAGRWSIGTIAVGASETITLNATIDTGQGGNTITNITTAAQSADVADPSTAGDVLEASLVVDPPEIDAVDDGTTGVNGRAGATGVVNVFDNDTVSGSPFAPADVNLTNMTPGVPLTLNPDGTVDVPAGTPAGVYTVTYQICIAAYPTICDTAEVSVTVDPPVIDAVDDSTGAVADGTNGSPDHINVFDNDTLDGASFVPAEVILTEISQSPGNHLVLQPDGTIDVPPGTPAGTYTLEYRICDAINPTICDTAVATVVVEQLATISGYVYEDSNGNGLFDPASDARQGGYTVELVVGGLVIDTTVTAADGSYSLTGIPAAPGYRLVFRDPGGNIIGGISDITLSPGQDLTDQNMPINPSGVVYDALTRQLVQGAVVTMTDGSGNPLPAACLVDPAWQGQTTGPDGGYRFQVIPGADPACPAGETRYVIEVAPPAAYVQAVSTILPPMPGDAELTACTFDAVPGGACQTSDSISPPPPGVPAIYALSILLEAGDPFFMHNHIPVDPVPATTNITVTKVADRRLVHRGERVEYTIEVTNEDANTHTNLTLVDIIPAGFRFVPGSATVDGVAATPTESGARLEFTGLTLGPNQTIVITIQLDVLSTAGAGRYVNRARIYDSGGNLLAAEATATVEVQIEAVFDCSDVIGRVFDDRNRNGYADDGEPGLPAVRIATVNGVLITTDRHGRFHVACADIPDSAIGSNFILKLDTRTLPTGYRVTTENPRVVRLTAGKTVKVNFGAAAGRVVRLDINGGAFEDGTTALKPKWRAGIDQLIEVLRKEHSVLRLIYRATPGEGELARQRVNAIIAIVRERWDSFNDSYPLEIESEILN
ncbi:MAG: hypothetical protein R3D45_15140 [Rhizobiaceae bacterium]